jgi:hypothetical protein
MAKQKNPVSSGERPHRNPNADRSKVHREIFARRLEGGAPATPEAYARAIEQWQQLPGAIVSVPVTHLTSGQAAPTPANTSGAAPPSEAQDEE